MKSLKATLGFGLIISLVAIVLLQWWLVSVTFREITENYVVSRLQQEVDMLLGGLVFNNAGKAELRLDQETHFDNRPLSGHYYHIRIGEQILRSPTLWDQELPIAEVTVGERRQYRQPGPLDQQLLILAQGFRKQGHEITIAVAEDISAIEQQIAAFQRNYFLLSAALLALLLLLQHFLVRRTLRPLDGVQEDLQKLGRGERDNVREEVPAEIRPLVSELNRLLNLLSQRVDRSRQMVGNLAHALKTPLSILVQTSESPELDDRPHIRRQIAEQTHTIRDRLERELSRARLAGDSSSGRRFSPADDLPELINVLRQAYPGREIDLTVDGTVPAWPAEREDMLEMSGNLIDNACKWAKNSVSVSVPDMGLYQLIVEDDGPGCGDDARARIGERGRRFDEQAGGHGLGLSIVRDIVEHYDGELAFDESAAGGLKVTVTLPGVVGG